MGEWYDPAGSDLFFCGLACLALVGRTFFPRQPYPILDCGCMFLEACAGLQYLHLLFCPEVLNRFYSALSEAALLPERWLNHALESYEWIWTLLPASLGHERVVEGDRKFLLFIKVSAAEAVMTSRWNLLLVVRDN